MGGNCSRRVRVLNGPYTLPNLPLSSMVGKETKINPIEKCTTMFEQMVSKHVDKYSVLDATDETGNVLVLFHTKGKYEYDWVECSDMNGDMWEVR